MVSILLLLLIGGVVGAGLVIWLNDKGGSGRESLMAPPPATKRLPSQLDAAEMAEIQALLARGEKLEAIKRVRELTGLGLKEAKDYVQGL